MSRSLVFTLALFAGVAAQGEEVPYMHGTEDVPNLSEWREARDLNVSVFGDIRRDGAFSQPAKPYFAWDTTLRLGYAHQTVLWEPQAPVVTYPGQQAPEKGVVEKRDEISFLWRQATGLSWFSFEVLAKGSHDDRSANTYSWGDPETNFVFTLWQERYQAIDLVLGCYHPIGDSTNWLDSHGQARDFAWTPKLGLRGSFAVGLAAINLRGSYARSIAGSNRVDKAPTDQNDTIEHTYGEVDLAAAISYRLTSWLRFGAEQAYRQQRWAERGSDTPTWDGSRVVSAPLVGTIECTVVPETLYLLGYYGLNLQNHEEFNTRDRRVFGATLNCIF